MWWPAGLGAHPAWARTHHLLSLITHAPWSCHLKLLQWVWETFLALRLLKTHTSHSSECILGFHSLILWHMQTHICIPLYECTHRNKMMDQEVPKTLKSAASNLFYQHILEKPSRFLFISKKLWKFQCRCFLLTLLFLESSFTIRWNWHPVFIILPDHWGWA